MRCPVQSESHTLSRLLAAIGLLAATAAGCGHRTAAQPASDPSHAGPPVSEGYGYQASSDSRPPAPRALDSRAQAESAPAAPGAGAIEEPRATERPGLGTEWGETRSSHISEVQFRRAHPSSPDQLAELYYNDYPGVKAMARYADWRELASASTDRGFITVALHDEGGNPLRAVHANGRTYAIGEAGQRYTIVLHNNTGHRLEAVASVDGLDVLDGKEASYSKRGYLVPAWGDVEIDGFRQSMDEVAAFRFGAVRDSYAARTGSDRNVGVIGVAVFAEEGDFETLPWTREEIERRRTADPFPGRFASPPPLR